MKEQERFEAMLLKVSGGNKQESFFNKENTKLDLMNDTQRRGEVLKRIREESGKKRPSIKDFYNFDIYSDEELKEDEESLQQRIDEFEAESEELSPSEKAQEEFSEIYEYVVISQLDVWLKGGKFGLNSKFDDVKRGIDAYGMFKSLNSVEKYLGLGIDVRFGSDKSKIAKKFKSVESVLRKKLLPEIKYFIDAKGNHKSQPVAKIIFGTTLGNAENIINLAQSKKQSDKYVLEHSVEQYKLIVQAKVQLEYFIEFARNEGNDKAVVAYSEMLEIFTNLYNQNINKINEYNNEIAQDEVCQYIKSLADIRNIKQN